MTDLLPSTTWRAQEQQTPHVVGDLPSRSPASFAQSSREHPDLMGVPPPPNTSAADQQQPEPLPTHTIANGSTEHTQHASTSTETMQKSLQPQLVSLTPKQGAYNDPATTQHVHQHTEPQPVAELRPEEDEETTDDGDDATEETTDPPINTSSEDARHAELLKLQEEINEMESAIDGLGEHYQIVDRLGEGTFSSVYKAIDLQHSLYVNDEWVARGPLDPLRKGVCHVALKKIYVTSSPQRIFNELSIMEDLRSAEYVSYLITAFRSDDQIVAVMPYSRHRDFRDYYKEMPLGDFKYYFRCLFSALQSVHEAGIMHRDIKPANFLYDPSTGHGTLCDFGLAERFEATEWRGKCHHTCPTPEHPHGTKQINRAVDSIFFEPGKPLAGLPSSAEGTAAATSSGLAGSASTGAAAGSAGNADALSTSTKSGMMDPPPERVGYNIYDARQGVRANRAGTRGFRAPEVLLKCQDQTVAIDIWSAGVILLTLLIRRFPVFNSNDDVEALLEIAVIFGKARMETCAMLHNRTFHCNIPTVGNSGSIIDFIHRLNPDLKNPGSHPYPEQYAQDVADALDMVKTCLHVDCTKRKTAAQLLQHPFLRVEPEEDEAMGDGGDEEYMQDHQDFADYYQGGDEQGMAAYHEQGMVANQVFEEDEAEDADENRYMRSEEVVQLQSRRGVQAEASEHGEPVPTALDAAH